MSGQKLDPATFQLCHCGQFPLPLWALVTSSENGGVVTVAASKVVMRLK